MQGNFSSGPKFPTVAGPQRVQPAGDLVMLQSLADCPACGCVTGQTHLYSKNGCDILRCTSCGLGHTQTGSFNPTAYYTQDYFTGGHSDGYADYLGAEPVLRREFSHTVAFLRRYKESGRLLEVGAAYGFFLQEARSAFDVTGIELSADAAQHARSRGLTVATGAADEQTLDGLGSFDAIVLLDVIEHLPHPDVTLAICAEHLNPGGVILLTTGDFASPLARLTGAHWRLMTPPQHLWFFTPASLRSLAARLDLVVERIDHPAKIVPLSLIAFQLRRILRFGVPARMKASGMGVPVNLFDAMRVVLKKRP